MISAGIIAFFLAVIIFGLPSQRNFKDFAGNRLIWRSKWYIISTIAHGLLAIVVLCILIKNGITINFGDDNMSFNDHAWVYGIFAGLFYPGLLYSLIGTLSAVGIAADEGEENIKSSMDFYSTTLGSFIKDDIYKMTNKVVGKATEQLSKIEDLSIQDFLIAYYAKTTSEDAGKARETYEKMKTRLENLQHNDSSITEQTIRESSMEQILAQHLLKYGKKRFRMDLSSILDSISNQNS